MLINSRINTTCVCLTREKKLFSAVKFLFTFEISCSVESIMNLSRLGRPRSEITAHQIEAIRCMAMDNRQVALHPSNKHHSSLQWTMATQNMGPTPNDKEK